MLLRDRFLTLDPPGGWLDRLDHNGCCVSEYMPASTLYHLLGAIDELSRFVGSSLARAIAHRRLASEAGGGVHEVAVRGSLSQTAAHRALGRDADVGICDALREARGAGSC